MKRHASYDLVNIHKPEGYARVIRITKQEIDPVCIDIVGDDLGKIGFDTPSISRSRSRKLPEKRCFCQRRYLRSCMEWICDYEFREHLMVYEILSINHRLVWWIAFEYAFNDMWKCAMSNVMKKGCHPDFWYFLQWKSKRSSYLIRHEQSPTLCSKRVWLAPGNARSARPSCWMRRRRAISGVWWLAAQDWLLPHDHRPGRWLKHSELLWWGILKWIFFHP